jgi:hypothetical protein
MGFNVGTPKFGTSLYSSWLQMMADNRGITLGQANRFYNPTQTSAASYGTSNAHPDTLTNPKFSIVAKKIGVIPAHAMLARGGAPRVLLAHQAIVQPGSTTEAYLNQTYGL